MRVMLRRFRGIAGMAALWGGTFGVVGAGYALWRFRAVTKVFIDGRDVTPPEWLVAVRGALIVAPWGLLAGTCFALGLIALAQSRPGWRAVDSLPTPRGAAAWGAVAAIALPMAAAVAAYLGVLPGHALSYGLPVRVLGAVALAGGAVAAGVVAVGRRPLSARVAAPQARALPRDV
jgi:hypothetical protein